MSSLSDLINVIKTANESFEDPDSAGRVDLGVLFAQSIRKTMKDIHHGANSDEFADLVIINLILEGDKQGYSTDELHEFIMTLKSDDVDDEFDD